MFECQVLFGKDSIAWILLLMLLSVEFVISITELKTLQRLWFASEILMTLQSACKSTDLPLVGCLWLGVFNFSSAVVVPSMAVHLHNLITTTSPLVTVRLKTPSILVHHLEYITAVKSSQRHLHATRYHHSRPRLGSTPRSGRGPAPHGHDGPWLWQSCYEPCHAKLCWCQSSCCCPSVIPTAAAAAGDQDAAVHAECSEAAEHANPR